jgi:PAS domain S-box-containing protein
MDILDYDFIFNSLQGHILVIDPDLKLRAVSQGILDVSGYKREEIIGQTVTNLFNGGRSIDQSFTTSLEYVLKHKIAHEMEVQVRGTDSVTYWKPKTYPLFDQKGEIAFLIHESFEVTNHISKQKILSAIEKELLKHTTLTDILDRQSDAFFIMDKNEYFTFVNKKMIEFGQFSSLDQMVGRPVREVFKSQDTDKFIKRYQNVLATKNSSHFIDVIDSRFVSVDAYATQDNSVAVFFRDVTEKLEREKEILENRAKLQIIADHIPAFVTYFDTEGKYQFVNKTYEEWYGLKPHQIIGKRRSEFETKETATIAQEYEERALRGEVQKYLNTLTKENRTIYLDVSYVPDIDEKTNIIRGAIGIGYDVTEQILARKEMEKALQLREDFMSIASHELKTPITSLSLQNQLLTKRFERSVKLEPDEIKRYLRETDKKIKRVNRLIDDMLDITRIQNGKMSLTFEPVDLVELTKDVAERYSIHIPYISVEDHSPIIGSWDRLRLDQVISNLLTNAIKYGNETPILISFGMENEHAILRVKDHGQGIARENQERIFQRFEREHRGLNVTGLGLGLFICKEILERHRGSISVCSETGKGAEFKVLLPLKSS